MPKTKKKPIERDKPRDIGAELLETIQSMKGEGLRVQPPLR